MPDTPPKEDKPESVKETIDRWKKDGVGKHPANCGCYGCTSGPSGI